MRRNSWCLLVFFVFGFIASACSDDGFRLPFEPDPDPPVEPDPGPTEHDPAVYTIQTWNVFGFDGGFFDGNVYGPPRITYYPEFAEMIKTNQPDVLCLQEVTGEYGQETGEMLNFASALIDVNYPMPYYARTSRGDGLKSEAYYSRYPVSNVEEIARSGDIQWNTMRIIQRFKVTFPGNVGVWFYNCHFSSAREEYYLEFRKKEARGLANYILAKHDVEKELIVLIGDMNTVDNFDWPIGLVGENTQEPARMPTGNPVDCTVAYLEFRHTLDPAKYFTSLTRLEIYPETSFFYDPQYPNDTDWLPLDHIILSPRLYDYHYVPGSAKLIGEGSWADNPSDHKTMRLQLEL